jgi:hypothetical protein
MIISKKRDERQEKELEAKMRPESQDKTVNTIRRNNI